MSIRRGPLIGLVLFVVAMVAATWLIVAALAPTVPGSQRSVAADFSDASGLKAGNDVRRLGVRVGKVSSVRLHGTVARVTFTVTRSTIIYTDTSIAIRYLNLVGERFLDIVDSPTADAGVDSGTANNGGSGVQSRDSVLPLTQTVPSFDITALFNGLRPVFQVLDPAQINTFLDNVLAVVQGKGGDVGSVVEQLNTVTRLVSNRSEVIAQFITGLGSVARQIQYKSPRLNDLISRVGDGLNALAVDLDATGRSTMLAARALRPTKLLVDTLDETYFGNYADVDRLLRKYVPATNNLTAALAAVPGLLDSLATASAAASTVALRCPAGRADAGAMPTVLLAGAPVVICR